MLRSASWLGGSIACWCRRMVCGHAVPGEIRAQLGLSRGEWILAAGCDPDGNYAVIATDRALHYQALPRGWSCLGWEQVAGVGWDRWTRRLVITGLGSTAPSRTVLRLRQCGGLPALGEERITHTRLGRWNVMLGGERRVLVEVRRHPVTDELVWAAGDGEPAIGDPDARRKIDDAVARLGEHLGIRR